MMDTQGYTKEEAGAVCGALEQRISKVVKTAKNDPIRSELGARHLATASKEELTDLLKNKKVYSFTGKQGGSSSSTSADKMYIKGFLLDSSTNYNAWGVTKDSIPRNIGSFIGKPIVAYKNTGNERGEPWRVPGEFDHPVLSDKDYNHALAYQDLFKVATIIDINHKVDVQSGNDNWWWIAEVIDEGTKRAFREDPLLPVFDSPTIALSAPNQPEDAIHDWFGMHVALVDRPAFGIKKAYMSGQCEGDSQTCLLTLRKAAIEANGGTLGCGFCTYGALMALKSQNNILTSQVASERNDSKIKVNMNTTGNEDNDASAGNKSRGKNLNKDNVPEVDLNKGGGTTTSTGRTPLPDENEGKGEAGEKKKVVRDIDKDDKGQEKPLAADQEILGGKPEGTSDEDYEAFKQRTKSERRQVDRNEGRNASVAELLATIEKQAQTIADLRAAHDQDVNDFERLKQYTSTVNDRVAALETERAEAINKARYKQIAYMVNASESLKDSPKEIKDRQIEDFHNSKLSIEVIRGLIEPHDVNYKAAAQSDRYVGSNAGYYRTKLATPVREASQKDPITGKPAPKPYFLESLEADFGKEAFV